MEKLKIAFYTDSYLPIKDGVTRYIATMRKELERRGHEVFVITAGDRKTRELAETDPHLIVLRGIKFIDNKSVLALDPTVLLQAITGRNFDIIHAHSPFSVGLSAAFISRITKARLVSTFHTHFFHRLALSKYISYTSEFLSSNRVLLKISKFFMVGYLKLYYLGCDKVISPSKFAKRLLRRNGIKNVEVVENGVTITDKLKISKGESRKLLGFSGKDKIILYLGRVDKEKNLAFLLKAAKSLAKKGFKIVIAGRGPHLDYYRNKSMMRGLENVYFAGFIKEEEKKYYYRAADIFCNPSTFDTACIADLEAMNFNLPILVPKIGAQAEFITKGNSGETFSTNNVSEFVAKATKIMKSKRHYLPRFVARKFNIRASADKLVTLYRKVLSKKRTIF